MSDIKEIKASFRKLSSLYLGNPKNKKIPYEFFNDFDKERYSIVVDGDKAFQAGIEGNIGRSLGALGQRIYCEIPHARVMFLRRPRLIIEFQKETVAPTELADVFSKISENVITSRRKHPADQVKHAANEIFKTQSAIFDQLVEINGPEQGLKLYCAALRAASAKDDFSRGCLEYT